MRKAVMSVAVVMLLAGCGDAAPPDAATSERLVTDTVLEWHRLQAAHDGEAGCELLTEKLQAQLVELDAEIAALVDRTPAEDCPEAVAHGPKVAHFQELMLNTQVDAVRLDGERATVTAHTTGTVAGVLRDLPPAQISLRWVGGRWLLD